MSVCLCLLGCFLLVKVSHTCPSNVSEYKKGIAELKCTDNTYGHCLVDELNTVFHGCLKRSWVQPVQSCFKEVSDKEVNDNVQTSSPASQTKEDNFPIPSVAIPAAGAGILIIVIIIIVLVIKRRRNRGKRNPDEQDADTPLSHQETTRRTQEIDSTELPRSRNEGPRSGTYQVTTRLTQETESAEPPRTRNERPNSRSFQGKVTETTRLTQKIDSAEDLRSQYERPYSSSVQGKDIDDESPVFHRQQVQTTNRKQEGRYPDKKPTNLSPIAERMCEYDIQNVLDAYDTIMLIVEPDDKVERILRRILDVKFCKNVLGFQNWVDESDDFRSGVCVFFQGFIQAPNAAMMTLDVYKPNFDQIAADIERFKLHVVIPIRKDEWRAIRTKLRRFELFRNAYEWTIY